MYACICKAVTQADVRHVGRAGSINPDSLIAVLGLADEDCCGRCVDNIDEFVSLAWEGAAEANLGTPADFAFERPVRYAASGALAQA